MGPGCGSDLRGWQGLWEKTEALVCGEFPPGYLILTLWAEQPDAAGAEEGDGGRGPKGCGGWGVAKETFVRADMGLRSRPHPDRVVGSQRGAGSGCALWDFSGCALLLVTTLTAIRLIKAF